MPKKDVQKTIRLTSEAVDQLNIMEENGIPTMPLIRGLIDAAIDHFKATGEISFPVKVTIAPSLNRNLAVSVPENRPVSLDVSKGTTGRKLGSPLVTSHTRR